MLSMIFVLLSLSEIISGFRFFYRILNVIAIGFAYASYKLGQETRLQIPERMEIPEVEMEEITDAI